MVRLVTLAMHQHPVAEVCVVVITIYVVLSKLVTASRRQVCSLAELLPTKITGWLMFGYH